MKQQSDTSIPDGVPQHLIVVRSKDGGIIRAALRWPITTDQPSALPPLPETLEVWNESAQRYCSVELGRTKAVFFVRTYAGNSMWHEHVRFFGDGGLASNLWVRIRMTDGEVLEGRTANGIDLLSQPGFWLWPTDAFGNNLLVYIPKSSVSDFHVMALDAAQLKRAAADAEHRELEDPVAAV